MTTSTTNDLHLSHLHLTHPTKPYARVKPVSDDAIHPCCVLATEGRPEQSIPMTAEAVADVLVRIDGYTLMS